MAEEKKTLTITEQIDTDEGLKSKRKLLTVTSLILLALSFSGAKVEEANTFILKLSFGNQKGISLLLVLAIIFLLIRYYNYACKYHQQLYKLWTNRLLRNSFFFYVHPHAPDYSGLIIELEPKGFDIKVLQHEECSWSLGYKCSLPFVRKITYHWHDEHDDYEDEAWIGWKNYAKVICLEAKYQLSSLVTYRENLDILAPYILGLFAISSYFYNDQFQVVLKMLAVK